MEATELQNLADRTRRRDASVWVTLDWGGLLDPLADVQESLNVLGLGSTESYMAISDEAWDIKTGQRDQTNEIDRAELDQDRLIVDNKAATEREKLSIQIATDEYLLAVRVYDAKVRALLMAAREYANQVEIEALDIERRKNILGVAKEQLRGDELNAKVYFEVIARAQVEADLAKAQVDVAKAHVRALMADIEAGRAQVELVEAQVQKYQAMADKATLQADVAMIFAEIVTKQLSSVKLDVGRKEIQAGFGYVQSKLDDMLAIWGTRTFLEQIKTELEAAVQASIQANLAGEEAAEDLKEKEIDDNRIALTHEIAQTAVELEQEAAVRHALTSWRILVQRARKETSIQQQDKQTWAAALINRAQRFIHKNSYHGISSYLEETTLISGG